MKLFEKDVNGLLTEVDPALAETTKAGRRTSQTNLEIEVLFTSAEEDEANAFEKAQTDLVVAAKKLVDTQTAAAEAKLQTLGLTKEDLKVLLS